MYVVYISQSPKILSRRDKSDASERFALTAGFARSPVKADTAATKDKRIASFIFPIVHCERVKSRQGL
jgi:hypothetical protein